MSFTAPPVARVPSSAPGPSARRWPTIAISASLGLVLVVGLLVGLGRDEHGTLVVSAYAPHGSELPGLRVEVDGETRCTGSPCQLEGLTPGQHLIRVAAQGYRSAPTRTITVGKNSRAFVEVALERSAAEPPERTVPPDPPRAAATSAEADPVDVSALSTASEPARVAAPTPGQQPRPQLIEHGTLRVNSIPPSRVLVDGRPRGATPLVLTVTPGQHSVVFMHPGRGRRATSVAVQAGKTAVASTRF